MLTYHIIAIDKATREQTLLSEAIKAASDDEAIEVAHWFVDGHILEVWQGWRRVIRLAQSESTEVTIVPEYRVVFLNSDTDITQPRELLDCANDQEAIQKARQFIDGRDIELWKNARVIARFPHTAGK